GHSSRRRRRAGTTRLMRARVPRARRVESTRDGRSLFLPLEIRQSRDLTVAVPRSSSERPARSTASLVGYNWGKWCPASQRAKEMLMAGSPPRYMAGAAGSLVGRVCMVTGATGALGKATASEFARRGATVVAVSRDEGRGRALLASVRQASGAGSVELLVADLSDLRSVRTLAKSFGASHDRLGILVNNAAVFKRRRIETADGFELMFATNFLGPFLLTNLLAPALRAGAPSRVITVSAPTTTELDFADLQSSANCRP